MKNQFIKLQKIIKNSYSPYSKFRVAAIAETDIGEFAGVNIENSAFPVTICAERNAIFSAITNGAKHINRISLLTDHKNGFGMPCGSCRQVMTEFMNANDEIIIYSLNGDYKKYTLNDLLPFSFTKEDLKGEQ